jgi:predicted TIM-barrel fold metal-dependent hydrolase
MALLGDHRWKTKYTPDDGALVDLIAEIAPTEAQRQKLLVDNPRRLYATKSAPN